MSVTLHPVLATFWLASILIDGILAYLSFRTFHRKNTRVFAFYILTTTVVSASLFGCSLFFLGWSYTIVWAVGSVVEQVLALCVAISCFNSLFRVRAMPAGFSRRMLAPIILVGFLASALYSEFSHAHSGWFVLELAALQSTTTFIAGVFWVLSFVSDHYGIPWGTRTFGIGLGFLFQFSIAIALNMAYLYSPLTMYWILSGIGIVSHVLASAIWLKFFIKPEPKFIALTNEELRSFTNDLRESVESINLDSRRIAARQ